MSFEQPSLEEFTPWMTEALAKTTLTNIWNRYLKIKDEPWGNVGKKKFRELIIDPPTNPVEQAHRKQQLIEPLYQLYLFHASSHQHNQKRLQTYRKFWKFAFRSKHLLALPFFVELDLRKKVIAPDSIENLTRILKQELDLITLSKLEREGITPQIFGQATPEDLRWALDSIVDLSAGEKLQLIKIHRDFIQSK